jgi:ribosomal protein S12 methylthiotransferase
MGARTMATLPPIPAKSTPPRPEPKRVGMVSLGCPKALVDPNASSPACAPMAMP